MLRCPCCNCLTIDNYMYPIVEICEVCYWQYDEVAQVSIKLYVYIQ